MISVGDLLVAPPRMADDRFSQSVIMMIHSGQDGHWGICLNKETGMSVSDMLRPAGVDVDIPVDMYWGGPVNQGVIWILHDKDWFMPTSIDLNDEWSMTSHKSMFDYLKSNGAPSHWRMFSGFSAWGPGQLEAEIEGEYPWSSGSSWLICKGSNPEWAFDQDTNFLWKDALTKASEQTIASWL